MLMYVLQTFLFLQPTNISNIFNFKHKIIIFYFRSIYFADLQKKKSLKTKISNIKTSFLLFPSAVSKFLLNIICLKSVNFN